MKRLLCIIDSLNVGGAETFLMKNLRCLPPEDYSFDFVVSKRGGAYEEEVLARGGRIYEVPPRRQNLPLALKEICRVVKEQGYRYIFRLGDEPVVAMDLLAAKWGGAKHIAFRSCNALTGLSAKARLVNAVMRPVLNGITDTKIAPSTLAAEFTFGKRAALKTHILHNGVDLTKFCYHSRGREEIRKEFSLENKFVAGHVGRFNKQKNHPFLLEIFQDLCRQRQDAVLLLVGVGEEEEKIRQKIRELDLEKNVILAGQRFDIPQLLSAMDVFVFPSFHEGMPNTVIEAQATGLPCVIADTITREADITGLVHYLSLEDPVSVWTKLALEIAEEPRRDTAEDFKARGYDIQSVARELVSLVFPE